MGYMTFYNLCWDAEENSAEEHAIIAWIDSDELRENFEDLYPGGASGMSKWYENEEDMIRLSQAFPHILFTLCGAGEEETDLWRSYYRSGMVQHAPAEIHYPPFDPARLTSPAARNPPGYEATGEDSPEADALANHEARKGPWA